VRKARRGEVEERTGKLWKFFFLRVREGESGANDELRE
jgi:hypothetical protein